VVSEDPAGVLIGYRDVKCLEKVNPYVLDAFTDTIVGFSYSLIDDLVAGELVKSLYDSLKRNGLHTYMYYFSILHRRIAGMLVPNIKNIIFETRLKKIYRTSMTVTGLFRRLIPKPGVSGFD
jgi:hypothetical protein